MKSKELRACLAGILVTALAPGAAFAGTNFVQKSLVSGHDGVADNTDPNLAGSWGISSSPTSLF